MKVVLATIVVLGCCAPSAFACSGIFDLECNLERSIKKPAQDAGKTAKQTKNKAAKDANHTTERSNPAEGSFGILHPVRQYLREVEIPPADVAAYGLVALKSRPTASNSKKLLMVCNSFLAHFDRAEISPYPASDQMVTIWPLNDPENKLAKADNCEWILQDYILGAASTAIAYAVKQHMTFEGEGPFLIGWSPASSRGEPDKLVLVVDMSTSNDQASIDHDFDFWKDKIVKDPASWRSGFSLEAIRQKIKDFVDHYGDDIVKDIKMVGL